MNDQKTRTNGHAQEGEAPISAGSLFDYLAAARETDLPETDVNADRTVDAAGEAAVAELENGKGQEKELIE